MSFYDLEDLDTTPLVYQVDTIIPQTGTGYLWGPSWLSAKTLLAIDMGLAVGNGTPFLGRPTIRGKVAYLPGEGFVGIGVRAKARLARQQRDDTEAIASVARTQGDEAARAFAAHLPAYTGANFKVRDMSFPMHFTRGGRPGPELDQAMNELTRMNTPGPDEDPETFDYLSLVILDTLANFAGELSISNDASASRITKTMNWMAAKLDCFVLALAHPTADGQKMLGAGRFANSADAVIQATPDEVAAPGALQTVTLSCLKNKDGTRWPSFGYRVRPCEWDEPELDDDSRPTGATLHVTSATVELIEDEAKNESAPIRREIAPLPEIRDPAPTRPAKRNGLRPRARAGLHLVTAAGLPGAVPVPDSVLQRKAETSAILDARVTPPAPAIVPASGPQNAARDLARSLLAVRCPVCSRPASMGCDARMTPAPWPLARTASGQTYIHEDRIVAAALAQPDPEGFLVGATATLTAAAARTAPAPASPKPDLDKKLWWTSVRPDSKLADA